MKTKPHKTYKIHIILYSQQRRTECGLESKLEIGLSLSLTLGCMSRRVVVRRFVGVSASAERFEWRTCERVASVWEREREMLPHVLLLLVAGGCCVSLVAGRADPDPYTYDYARYGKIRDEDKCYDTAGKPQVIIFYLFFFFFFIIFFSSLYYKMIVLDYNDERLYENNNNKVHRVRKH